ncbi:methionine s-methyltransferase [Hordeum vulgare]|nr:methionine s-methyltransferase [Hordeum vulgare]
MTERVDVVSADLVVEPGTVVLALLGRATRHGGEWRELEGEAATICATAKMKKKTRLSLSLGSGKEGEQLRGDKGANGLLELIDERGTWKREMLQHHFMQLDVDEILKLHPSPRMQNVLAWGKDPKGIFSVKSSYNIGMEDKRRTSSCATSRAPDGKRAI